VFGGKPPDKDIQENTYGEFDETSGTEAKTLTLEDIVHLRFAKELAESGFVDRLYIMNSDVEAFRCRRRLKN
jgi:hypothetical protein